MTNTIKKATAVVKFEGVSKRYYFKNFIEELEVGDKVVVDTINGLAVATVVDLLATSSPLAKKLVVQRIDLEAHERRLEEEKERLAKAMKLQKIKSQMSARRREIDDIEIYQLLALKDPEMAKLITEYNSLV